jgi:hypothetical protein
VVLCHQYRCIYFLSVGSEVEVVKSRNGRLHVSGVILAMCSQVGKVVLPGSPSLIE